MITMTLVMVMMMTIIMMMEMTMMILSRWWPTAGLASQELVLHFPIWQVRHHSWLWLLIWFGWFSILVDYRITSCSYIISLPSWGGKAAGGGEGGEATVQASQYLYLYIFHLLVFIEHWTGKPGRRQSKQRRAVEERALQARVCKWGAERRALSTMSLLPRPATSMMSLRRSKLLPRVCQEPYRKPCQELTSEKQVSQPRVWMIWEECHCIVANPYKEPGPWVQCVHHYCWLWRAFRTKMIKFSLHCGHKSKSQELTLVYHVIMPPRHGL